MNYLDDMKSDCLSEHRNGITFIYEFDDIRYGWAASEIPRRIPDSLLIFFVIYKDKSSYIRARDLANVSSLFAQRYELIKALLIPALESCVDQPPSVGADFSSEIFLQPGPLDEINPVECSFWIDNRKISMSEPNLDAVVEELAPLLDGVELASIGLTSRWPSAHQRLLSRRIVGKRPQSPRDSSETLAA
jgi:hypothetical protein